MICLGPGSWISPGLAAADGEKSYEFVYHTEWGATDVGTSQARWSIAEDQFFMHGESAANGLASVVADFAGYVSVRSRRRPNGWQATQLVIASSFGRETSLAETFWSEDGQSATTTAQPPPDTDKVYPVTDEMRVNVTDPFSAMKTMLDRLQEGEVCEQSFQIYDGRRRAELSFSDLGTARLEPDRAFAFAGETRVCGIISTPLGGHWRDSQLADEDPNPEDIKAFVTELAPGVMVPVRIEVELFFGRLITRLDMDRSVF